MNAGHYTAEQVTSLTPDADDLEMRVFFLQEDPDAGWYIGGSVLGAQKWAIAQDGTAEYLGTLGHVLKGEIVNEDGEYV